MAASIHSNYFVDHGIAEQCSCLEEENDYGLYGERFLEDTAEIPLWETVVVAVTLVIMLGFMMFERIGPDWVMAAGAILFMTCGIITFKEGTEGFANEGIMTVMSLFVVAEGISRTGALDHYFGMLLGNPKTVPGAQIRLMVPIAILSAFLNNTPIVAVMIPLTLRWATKIGVPKEQLLIPLSYATILGGTCTLVGTSTNIVVAGLLQKDYPDEAAGNIGIFDLAIYGVPNAIIGIAYMVAFGALILPSGRGGSSTDADDLLFGAVVQPWSPAAGRTYKRSGLGNSGGIFLANVRRAATGNVHRAVSKDFVISAGDELFFTGSVEKFVRFCEKHGLQIITPDNQEDPERQGNDDFGIVHSTGAVDYMEQLRQIRHLSDQIEGYTPVEPGPRPVQLFVALDETDRIAFVGVDCEDHHGLLKHISDGISEQGFHLRHTEAKVFDDRSLSVWRCESTKNTSLQTSDLDELWAVVYQSLKESDRALVAKTSGSQVVRAYITKSSSLIGKKPLDVDFRTNYKASIVAYQKNGKNSSLDDEFGEGDLLVLHTAEVSPLLSQPPEDFYQKRPSKDLQESDIEVDLDGTRQAWSDLKVSFDDHERKDHGVPKGEFLTAFTVPPNSSIVGKSVSSMGYAKLPGTVLIGIERPDGVRGTSVVTAEDALQVGDVLWYSGSAEAIADLQRVKGLAFYHDKSSTSMVPLTERRLVQAVIARGSMLVGQTVREAHFRSAYGGVVISIQRGSDRVHELPANVQLKTGDVLLIEAGASFVEKHEGNYRTFALLSEVDNSSPPRPRLFLLTVVLTIAMLAVAAVEIRSLFVTASIVGIIMVSLGLLTQQEARDCLQWDLYVTVAAAFGIGNAMKNSGVASAVATVLVSIGHGFGLGEAGVYGAVYFAGNLMSAVLTNNAAATLMFPIAMSAVNQTGGDRLKMSMILMLSASDYITSFGYQTNLMVYGPGGYRNVDFFKFGAPMQILLWLSTTAMVSTLPISNPKWVISWIVCAIGFAFVAVTRLTGSLLLFKKKEDANGVGKRNDGMTWQLSRERSGVHETAST